MRKDSACLRHFPVYYAVCITVETVTTVGYGDILPTGIMGRSFAIVVMLFGVSLGLYSLSSMGEDQGCNHKKWWAKQYFLV